MSEFCARNIGPALAEPLIGHDAHHLTPPPLPKIQARAFSTLHGYGDTSSNPFPAPFLVQVVEEGWLVRWRKFVLGRGARRYHAPGEMDNRPLLVGPSTPRKVSEPERAGLGALSFDRVSAGQKKRTTTRAARGEQREG